MLKGLLKKLKKGTTTNPLIKNSPYTPYGEKEPFIPAKQDVPLRDFPRQANVEMGNILEKTKRRKIAEQEMKNKIMKERIKRSVGDWENITPKNYPVNPNKFRGIYDKAPNYGQPKKRIIKGEA